MKIYKVDTKNLSGKLKELKTWAQVKSPKRIQPVLSYALDWLAPELLGTGFRLFELNDFELKAIVPANKSNLDSQGEIHQGLATNAALELARVFLQRQMPESSFRMTATDTHLIKKQLWNEELTLVIQSNQSDMDDFFLQLQKGKKSVVEFEIKISCGKNRKKNDEAHLKLTIESTPLIA